MKLGNTVKKFKSKKGKSVVVRYITWDDLDDILAFANSLIREDTFVMIHGKELSRDEEIDYLARSIKSVMKGKKIHLVILVDGKFAGNCEINQRRRRSKHVGDIGISIAKPFRDEGIGTELLKVLVEEGRKQKYKLLVLTLFDINRRARRVYEKLGFKSSGTTPGVYLYKEKYHGEITMYLPLANL